MMAAALADGVVDTVLTAGLVANVMLAASRRRHRRARHGLHPRKPARAVHRGVEGSILAAHGEKIVLPADLAYVEGGVRVEVPRRGPARRRAARRPRPRRGGRLRARASPRPAPCSSTAPRASSSSPRPSTARRPCGQAMADCPGFSALGGGDSVAAMNRFGLADALRLRVHGGRRHGPVPVSGKPMPVIEALKDAARALRLDRGGREVVKLAIPTATRSCRSACRTAAPCASSPRAATPRRRRRRPARPRRPTRRPRCGAPWREPIGAPPLRELAAAARSAVVVVSDVTRPCPSYKFLPALLDRARAAAAGAHQHPVRARRPPRPHARRAAPARGRRGGLERCAPARPGRRAVPARGHDQRGARASRCSAPTWTPTCASSPATSSTTTSPASRAAPKPWCRACAATPRSVTTTP